MKLAVIKITISLLIGFASSQDYNITLCKTRVGDWRHNQHNYWYSGLQADLPAESRAASWSAARQFCRLRCMDLVSLESEFEWRTVRRHLKQLGVKVVWTSGHLCTPEVSDRCSEEESLQPLSVYGWYWAGSSTRLPPTNSTGANWSINPWATTGPVHKEDDREKTEDEIGRASPDNAEQVLGLAQGKQESCMAVFQNRYEAGLVWDDSACYHEFPWLCEDSEELLLESGLNLPVVFG